MTQEKGGNLGSFLSSSSSSSSSALDIIAAELGERGTDKKGKKEKAHVEDIGGGYTQEKGHSHFLKK